MPAMEATNGLRGRFTAPTVDNLAHHHRTRTRSSDRSWSLSFPPRHLRFEEFPHPGAIHRKGLVLWTGALRLHRLGQGQAGGLMPRTDRGNPTKSGEPGTSVVTKDHPSGIPLVHALRQARAHIDRQPGFTDAVMLGGRLLSGRDFSNASRVLEHLILEQIAWEAVRRGAVDDAQPRPDLRERVR